MPENRHQCPLPAGRQTSIKYANAVYRQLIPLLFNIKPCPAQQDAELPARAGAEAKFLSSAGMNGRPGGRDPPAVSHMVADIR